MKNLNLICCVLIFVAIASCNERKNTKNESNEKERKYSVENLSINSSEDVIIHFTKYGNQKDMIVFVHGWSCDQTYWKEQIEFFKNRYQVVTVDLAGHGKSTVGNRDNWTIPNLTNDLLKVLKSLQYNQVILIGHSLGAMVVIEASTHLDKERTKVVAVDYLKRPLRPLPEEVVEGYLGGFRNDFENSTKDFVSKMFRSDSDTTMRNLIMNDMSSAPKSVAIPLSKDLVTRDFTESFKVLADKKIPRYIVNSDLSPIDEAHYKELGFKMDVISETGHFLMIEKPLLFNQLIQKHLQF